MKKISISIETWRQLHQIKKKRDITCLSKVVAFLVNSHYGLKEADSHKNKEQNYNVKSTDTIRLNKEIVEIHRYVDELKI